MEVMVMDKRSIIIFLSIICGSISCCAGHKPTIKENLSRSEAKRLAVLKRIAVAKQARKQKKRSQQLARAHKLAVESYSRRLKKVEAQFAPRREQDKKRIEREQEQMEQELEALDSLVPFANSKIILYNANVPIESLSLTESGFVYRQGKPRSINHGVWEIPINIDNEPFALSLKANGKEYVWHILSIAEISGNEFCLIQEKVSRESDNVELTMKQVTCDMCEHEYPVQLRSALPIKKNVSRYLCNRLLAIVTSSNVV